MFALIRQINGTANPSSGYLLLLSQALLSFGEECFFIVLIDGNLCMVVGNTVPQKTGMHPFALEIHLEVIDWQMKHEQVAFFIDYII